MWYRSWLEVRWKMLLMVVLNSFITALLLDDPASAAVWRQRLGGNIPLLFAMNGVVLAGCGIASQLSQKPGYAVHPSTLFLLSLPVTRARLVMVRLTVGALATLAIMSATLVVFYVGAPELRSLLSTAELVLYLLSIGAMALSVYAVSGLLSTVLDQLWQTYGTMALMAAVLGLVPGTRFWRVLFVDGSGLPVASAPVTSAPIASTSVATTSIASAYASLGTVYVGISVCVLIIAVGSALAVRIVRRKQF